MEETKKSLYHYAGGGDVGTYWPVQDLNYQPMPYSEYDRGGRSGRGSGDGGNKDLKARAGDQGYAEGLGTAFNKFVTDYRPLYSSNEEFVQSAEYAQALSKSTLSAQTTQNMEYLLEGSKADVAKIQEKSAGGLPDVHRYETTGELMSVNSSQYKTYNEIGYPKVPYGQAYGTIKDFNAQMEKSFDGLGSHSSDRTYEHGVEGLKGVYAKLNGILPYLIATNQGLTEENYYWGEEALVTSVRNFKSNQQNIGFDPNDSADSLYSIYRLPKEEQTLAILKWNTDNPKSKITQKQVDNAGQKIFNIGAYILAKVDGEGLFGLKADVLQSFGNNPPDLKTKEGQEAYQKAYVEKAGLLTYQAARVKSTESSASSDVYTHSNKVDASAGGYEDKSKYPYLWKVMNWIKDPTLIPRENVKSIYIGPGNTNKVNSIAGGLELDGYMKSYLYNENTNPNPRKVTATANLNIGGVDYQAGKIINTSNNEHDGAIISHGNIVVIRPTSANGKPQYSVPVEMALSQKSIIDAHITALRPGLAMVVNEGDVNAMDLVANALGLKLGGSSAEKYKYLKDNKYIDKEGKLDLTKVAPKAVDNIFSQLQYMVENSPGPAGNWAQSQIKSAFDNVTILDGSSPRQNFQDNIISKLDDGDFANSWRQDNWFHTTQDALFKVRVFMQLDPDASSYKTSGNVLTQKEQP